MFVSPPSLLSQILKLMVRSPTGSSDEPNANDDEHYDRPASILPEHSLRSTRKVSDTDDATHAKNRSPPKVETTDGSHELVTHRAGPEELEEEAGQQGAFNPETGEINWDCPCLGGMADGPCGEQFKIAFSCFVFSKEDPKGMDCIDKFKGMQACFQQVLLTLFRTPGYSTDLSSIQHPEVYGSELDGDEDDEDNEDNEGPTDQTERPSDSADIDNTKTPSTTTTNPTDSSRNRADAPISPVAGKSHTAEPIARPEPTVSAKQEAPAPPTGTAKSDPIVGVTKEDELVVQEASPHSKPEAGDPERKGGDKT